jgi:arylsulfatase A-like enzyme/tetratricopeptide (TPR) repeat protein
LRARSPVLESRATDGHEVSSRRSDRGCHAPSPARPCQTGVVLALLATGAAVSLGCGRGPATERGGAQESPPIVLISIDTLRSDRLPAYGYDGVATPAIDALARDAVLFERAYSHVPLTLPSHASLFTGRLPYEHGVRDNAGYRLGESFPTLAGLLHAAGYRTGGAVSSFVLRGETGVGRGFDFWDDELDLGGGELGEVERAGGATLEAALPWLRDAAASERPFLLFLHLFEPHAPYRPPEPYASRFAEPYDGEVAAADAVVGGLLDELRALGIYDRAVVALFSDHGEGLGDHGEQEHGVLLYREAIQVPLLVKLPRSASAGGRRSDPVQLADVLPTLLGLAGIAPPADLPGAAVLRSDGSAPPPRERRLFAETAYPRLHYGWSELVSLVEDRWHYIENAGPADLEDPDPADLDSAELYDLIDDPRESRNLLGPDPGAEVTVTALRQDLASRPRALVPPGSEDEETRARLNALGYLSSGSSGAPPAAGARGAPRDTRSRLTALARLERAAAKRASGDHAGAITDLRDLLADEPAMVDGWEELSRAYEALGSPGEALAARQRALELSGGAPEHALGVAALLLELARYDDAAAHARLGAGAFPAAAGNLEARIALAAGDLEAAQAAAQRAVDARAGRVTPLLTLAEVQLARGDAAGALARAREATAATSEDRIPDPRAPLLESRALRALGRASEAEESARAALERAAALERSYPAAPLAHTTAIEVHLDRGDLASAARAAERALDVLVSLGPLRARVALALLAGGDAQRALTLLERAPPPSDAASRHALALALTETGSHEEARRVLATLREEYGDGADVRESQGLVELRLGRPAAALDHLARAVALDPGRANAWNLLAVARWQGRRDGPGAVAAFSRALELEPQRWDSLFNLGMVAADAGLGDQARAALERFVREAPPERYENDIRAATARIASLGGE